MTTVTQANQAVELLTAVLNLNNQAPDLIHPAYLGGIEKALKSIKRRLAFDEFEAPGIADDEPVGFVV